MTTTCFLQSSVVSTPLGFPTSIANRRRNLSTTSPVFIHNLDIHHLIAVADSKVPLLTELNKDKNLIQVFEQRDPGHEISGKVLPSPTTMEANNSRFKFHLNSSNFVIMAALTVGVTVLLIDQKAMALGPEGPLMEEFWENMRRYALYALTVSTGVAYAVFQPLYELLRNPISAILVITIAVGSFYLVSQVLSAMVGVSDFNYEYSY